MTLSLLLRKLEEATGPDRDVDYALEEYFGGDLFSRFGYKRLPGDDGWDTSEPSSPATKLAPAQEFTSDVSYVIGLIERKLPNCSWGIESEQYYDNGTIRPRYIARLRAQGSPRLHVVASFATPALALCIALLKSLEPARPLEAREG